MLKIKLMLVGSNYRKDNELLSLLDEHNIITTLLDDVNDIELMLKRTRPDCILLDVNSFNSVTFPMFIKLRGVFNNAIIIHTEAIDESKQMLAYELGVDHCIQKHCDSRLLLSVIKNQVRNRLRHMTKKVESSPPTDKDEITLCFSGWRFVESKCSLTNPQGDPVELSAVEHKLLLTLLMNSGKTLCRERLLDQTKGHMADYFERCIDVTVSRLRKKIEDDSRHPRLIKTVRGLGYKFSEPVTKLR